MRPPPRLSNCYTPAGALPLPSSSSAATSFQEDQQRPTAASASTRNTSLRRVRIESNVLPSATGSTLVELGNTKVIGIVRGPLTSSSLPSNVSLSMDQGTLLVRVEYAMGYPTDDTTTGLPVTSLDSSQQMPSNTTRTQRQTVRSQQREISDLQLSIAESLSSTVPLQNYPKCAIVVEILILQNDGGLLPACLTAATCALMHAPMEVYDIVSACSVAVVPTSSDGTTNNKGRNKQILLVADPTTSDLRQADSVLHLAVMPNWKEQVVLWQQLALSSQQSNQDHSVTNEMVNLCREGCRTMHQLIRQHMLDEQQEKST